ncbi:hypothetical protein R3P38DRAFT_2815195 [Favolaschia claudopus]|uniref:HTH psq-type domain-containing protein n=1 Tax=Favolaschia claudopus TaxID=2862362 RepID=A0AAV9Z219_9AGAR
MRGRLTADETTWKLFTWLPTSLDSALVVLSMDRLLYYIFALNSIGIGPKLRPLEILSGRPSAVPWDGLPREIDARQGPRKKELNIRAALGEYHREQEKPSQFGKPKSIAEVARKYKIAYATFNRRVHGDGV